MKSTGIVREVDDLGRIVLPKELRNILQILNDEPLEFLTDNINDKAMIILRKYNPGCIICGNIEGCILYRDKKVCNDCLKEISSYSDFTF